jgi:hypothetical protein
MEAEGDFSNNILGIRGKLGFDRINSYLTAQPACCFMQRPCSAGSCAEVLKDLAMGDIQKDVIDGHLSDYPREKDFLRAFCHDFDITWGKRRRSHNTNISQYFLKPNNAVAELFGFRQEVCLFVTDFNTLEPRTMQAAESLLSESPAKGRADSTTYLLASDFDKAESWIGDYISRNPQSRIPVGFYTQDLKSNWTDRWFVRNILIRQLFALDLFNYTLPLEKDLYFFGRDALVADVWRALRSGQNRGLFGLRKTGKTSVLYKLRRAAEFDSTSVVLYYDCKHHPIRIARWHELLRRILEDASVALKIPFTAPKREAAIADGFLKFMEKVPADKRLAIIFDEIEYISPLAIQDAHWKADFLPFWQTLWAAQSEHRQLAFVIAGVNPGVCESDKVQGVQNPLFGIVQPTYVTGLEPEGLRKMLQVFGAKMGLRFDDSALEYLRSRYGAHPLLTRLACSILHVHHNVQGSQRPLTVTQEDLIGGEAPRDEQLEAYCQHIVTVLRDFYPDEYDILRMLASGEDFDVASFAQNPEWIRHLKNYGLLNFSQGGRPTFAIPVVGSFIGRAAAMLEGRTTARKVIQSSRRAAWIVERSTRIVQELRALDRLIEQRKAKTIYGINGFPGAERVVASVQVNDAIGFTSFIKTFYMSFVESIDNYGTSIKSKDYYWKDVRNNYPTLWRALQRVRVYRHNDMHNIVYEDVGDEVRAYLELDFEGRQLQEIPDPYFLLQQIVVDELLWGVIAEIEAIS